MRKNFGARTYLVPQPVMIIGTYDGNGKPNAMNAAWGGIVGSDEIIIDLGKHKTTENIMLSKAFTVSVGDEAHTVACDYVGIVSGSKEPMKMEKAGFTTIKSDFVNAPIICEPPLTLECELKDVIGNKILGTIKNVSADESIIGEDGLVSYENFTPIIYDGIHFGYHRLGEKVGQAFMDGGKLQ